MGLAPIVPPLAGVPPFAGTPTEAGTPAEAATPTVAAPNPDAKLEPAPAAAAVLSAATSTELQALRAAVPDAPSEAIPEQLAPAPSRALPEEPLPSLGELALPAAAAARVPSVEPEQTSAHSLAAPPRRRSRGLLWLLAGVAVLGVAAYWSTHRSPTWSVENALPKAVPPVVAAPPAPQPQAEPLAAPVVTDAPSPAASPSAALAEAAASPASGAASGVASAAAGRGSHSVTLNTVPPKGQFFHFGKLVGTAPFVVEIPDGEKRAFEIGLPGHITRKVVVDGSKPEITLGLKQQP